MTNGNHRTDDTTLLAALTRRGVLLSVSVRYWRARRKLDAEDIGLRRDAIDERLISLGHKRLLPKESLKRLALLEGRAHALVEENTFPFLGGVARYLPNAKLAAVAEQLRALQDEFAAEQARFLADYARTRAEALAMWRTTAAGLVDDPQRLVAAVSEAFPSPAAMPRHFGFEVHTFQVVAPDVPQAELVDIGTHQELIEARRQAAESARREIEASCRDFIADCTAALREQTARLCGEMLETMRSTGNVHQKTLNRLTRFIEHFGELNFVDDREMAEQLERVRTQLLERTAVEYRDSATARQTLVHGLSRLREHATKLAAQDTRELVENFGRLGHRRFNLAA